MFRSKSIANGPLTEMGGNKPLLSSKSPKVVNQARRISPQFSRIYAGRRPAAALLKETDQTLESTGGALANQLSRYAKGGKIGAVSSGLSRIKALADSFARALEMEDTETADRIGRQMDQIQPGSKDRILQQLLGAEQGVADQKLATFAKGGKVKKPKMKKTVLFSVGEEGTDLDGLANYTYDELVFDHKIPREEADQLKWTKSEYQGDDEHALHVEGPSHIIDKINATISRD